MAIDFPASPTNGQTFTSGSVTYTWDGTKWTAVAAAGSSNSISQGNTNATVTDTGSDGRFVVTTEGSERLRVDSSGRLGIGTTPLAPLHVKADTNANIHFNTIGVGTGDLRISALNDANSAFVPLSINAVPLIFKGTGGVEKARLDSDGRLLVGTSSSANQAGINGLVQVEATTADEAAIKVKNNSNNAYPASISLSKSRGTTVGSSTVVQNGDTVGSIYFFAADGTDTASWCAEITAAIDGTPGSNDVPGRLTFSTTADGASSPSTRMTLFSNGNIRAVETASAYFYPGIDNSIYLGSPSFRYNLVYSVNGTASSSDEREKTEINDAALGIDFIKSLRPVSYKWKVGHNDVEAGDEGDVVIPRPGLRTHWGFLAQDVKQAADQAGVDFGGWILTDVDDPESPQGLRYQQFIAPLTKALQEAIAKIETLEAKVAAFESA